MKKELSRGEFLKGLAFLTVSTQLPKLALADNKPIFNVDFYTGNAGKYSPSKDKLKNVSKKIQRFFPSVEVKLEFKQDFLGDYNIGNLDRNNATIFYTTKQNFVETYLLSDLGKKVREEIVMANESQIQNYSDLYKLPSSEKDKTSCFAHLFRNNFGYSIPQQRIAFVFPTFSNRNAPSLAKIVGHEIGHLLELEDIPEQENLMHPKYIGSTLNKKQIKDINSYLIS